MVTNEETFILKEEFIAAGYKLRYEYNIGLSYGRTLFSATAYASPDELRQAILSFLRLEHAAASADATAMEEFKRLAARSHELRTAPPDWIDKAARDWAAHRRDPRCTDQEMFDALVRGMRMAKENLAWLEAGHED